MVLNVYLEDEVLVFGYSYLILQVLSWNTIIIGLDFSSQAAGRGPGFTSKS